MKYEEALWAKDRLFNIFCADDSQYSFSCEADVMRVLSGQPEIVRMAASKGCFHEFNYQRKRANFCMPATRDVIQANTLDTDTVKNCVVCHFWSSSSDGSERGGIREETLHTIERWDYAEYAEDMSKFDKLDGQLADELEEKYGD